MPQLALMVQNGASGPIESLPPYLSPMLWNTIATGKHPAEHGIVGRAAARAQAEPLAILRPDPKPADAIAEMEPTIVVTGLPRSGTSLMMQMLARGGCPIKTDEIRAADAHNERGYFEWEAIKTLREHPKIIDEAAGSAVKVVSVQLSELPRGRPHRLIWMDRPVAEVLRSQEAMILARHSERTLPPREERVAALEAHRENVLTAFRAFAADAAFGLQLLEVSYHACLSDSAATAARVAAFLKHETLDPAKMTGAVDRRLHHGSGKKTLVDMSLRHGPNGEAFHRSLFPQPIR